MDRRSVRSSIAPWTVTPQFVLGVIGLFWAISLFPMTSFLWWIWGNLIYGGLGLSAALLYYHDHPRWGRRLALAALVVFALSNGIPGTLACTMGGACDVVIAVTAPVLLCQTMVVVASR